MTSKQNFNDFTIWTFIFYLVVKLLFHETPPVRSRHITINKKKYPSGCDRITLTIDWTDLLKVYKLLIASKNFSFRHHLASSSIKFKHYLVANQLSDYFARRGLELLSLRKNLVLLLSRKYLGINQNFSIHSLVENLFWFWGGEVNLFLCCEAAAPWQSTVTSFPDTTNICLQFISTYTNVIWTHCMWYPTITVFHYPPVPPPPSQPANQPTEYLEWTIWAYICIGVYCIRLFIIILFIKIIIEHNVQKKEYKKTVMVDNQISNQYSSSLQSLFVDR